MKKFGLALTSMILAFSVSAATFTEGKQYLAIKKPVTGAPQVVEFFSFYCPHCYDFEQIMHVSTAIKKDLPANVKYVKYHVNMLGPLASDLGHAWAIAMTLGVEDKVEKPLFDGIQKTNTIHTTDDIRQAFITAAGITAEEYDAAWNSFLVKSLAIQQAKAAENFVVQGVPATYVNGKYSINLEGIDNSSVENFAHQYAGTVAYLVSKK